MAWSGSRSPIAAGAGFRGCARPAVTGKAGGGLALVAALTGGWGWRHAWRAENDLVRLLQHA